MKYIDFIKLFIQILVLFIVLHAYVNPCGDVSPEVYKDDTSFIVIYYNTTIHKYFEDKYTAHNKNIYKRKEVSYDTIISKFGNNRASFFQGKNSPLGDYFPPFGEWFLKDTVLYTMAYLDLRVNIKKPYLEIKKGRKEKETYNLDWGFNRLNKIQQFIVGNKFLKSLSEKILRLNWDKNQYNEIGRFKKYIVVQRIYADGNSIAGVAAFIEEDTLKRCTKSPIELFIVEIGEDNVKYATIDSKTRSLFCDYKHRLAPTCSSIKKYGNNYVFIWGNEADECFICAWNPIDDSIINFKLQKDVICNYSTSFEIMDGYILIANMKRVNPNNYIYKNIVVNYFKYPFELIKE